MLKEDIQKATKEYTRGRTSEINNIISQLTEQVTEMENNLEEADNPMLDMLEKTRLDLEDAIFEKTKGVMFRTKARWMMEGERNTKYFYSIEKNRFNSRNANTLLKDDVIVNDPQDILKMQQNFYQELYTRDEKIVFELSNNSNIKIPPNSTGAQETDLTLEEIKSAVKQLSNNKTPGPDGIPIDFYKVFWIHIQQPLTRLIKYIHEKKELNESSRTGVLNLIPKQGKDKRKIENLRPITLLNADYKVIEKSLANRIAKDMDYIINHDQRGFLPDRRIAAGIRRVYDVIIEANELDKAGIMLNLDFSKAFDKLEFTAIQGALRYFGFSEYLQEWFKTLYGDFTVRVQNNGWFSDPINVTRSVHQGAPASSLLFLLVAETLAIEIRSNPEIEGFYVKEILNMLNQYADDMSACLEDNENALNALLRTLKVFYNNSGLQMSYDKTTIHRLGSIKKSDAKYYTASNISWTNDRVKVLGIWLSSDVERDLEDNYLPIIEKSEGILKLWSKRNLSLIGRVNIVNTLIASLFTYKMAVLPKLPRRFTTRMEKMIEGFLWNGARPKDPYSLTATNRRRSGGETH